MLLTLVKLAQPNGWCDVEAWQRGDWAAHRGIGPDLSHRWCVTHVPSGLRIPRDYTEEHAIRVARRLGNELRCPTMKSAVRAGKRVLRISDEERV